MSRFFYRDGKDYIFIDEFLATHYFTVEREVTAADKSSYPNQWAAYQASNPYPPQPPQPPVIVAPTRPPQLPPVPVSYKSPFIELPGYLFPPIQTYTTKTEPAWRFYVPSTTAYRQPIAVDRKPKVIRAHQPSRSRLQFPPPIPQPAPTTIESGFKRLYLVGADRTTPIMNRLKPRRTTAVR